MKTYEYGNPCAKIVLVQMVGDHDLQAIENEAAIIREKTEVDFQLIALKAEDWNRDLSPWKAPAVFGNADFGDGATDKFREVLEHCQDQDRTYYIGGYSLSGLFALWAAYQTDVFKGVAAASPSIWFPGFTEYMREHAILAGKVYLSLGDKEPHTRNPVMSKVGAKMDEACEILKNHGTPCTLEWNRGNHFVDADVRVAKAFAWVLKS